MGGNLEQNRGSWFADCWAGVYQIFRQEHTWVGRTDKFLFNKFVKHINSKDGNPRERQVLEFLVPILYPEKPS